MSIESLDSTANLRSKTKWWTPRLAWPVIAAAVVRFTLLAVTLARNGTSALIDSDTSSYLEPGRNLLLHGRFIADGAPDLLRTPGYPLFLAITSLAGLPAAAVANVILSVLSVVLVWKLGKTVFGDDRIALGAAWIFAFEPISVIYSSILLSEPLFIALFLLSLERLTMFLRERNLPVLVAAGLWLAAATFVRPVTYYLPAALAVGLFVVLARVPGLRWKAPAVLLISVLPWLAAWQIRNWIETGYSGFSSAGDEGLYDFVLPAVIGEAEHRSYMIVRDELGYPDFYHVYLGSSGQTYLSQAYLAQNPGQAVWSQGQRIAFIHSEAVRVIRAHFGAYLRLCFKSLFRTVFELGAGSLDLLLNIENPGHATSLIVSESLARQGIALTKASPWVAVEKTAFAIVLLGLYLFAARGAFHASMHDACLWLLLGMLLYFFTVSAMAHPVGAARFRLPIMSVVCIFASAGFLRKNTIAR
ncbi:MAG: glycosyltransferase family 39 protein [Terracidiphilus sp.]